jgi:hypothetical protein
VPAVDGNLSCYLGQVEYRLVSNRLVCRMAVAAVLIAATCVNCRQGLGEETQPDIRPLLANVRRIAAPGIPGPLSVAGKLSGEHLAPVVAAASFGKGRVIAFGHTGYLDTEAMKTADTGTFMANAVLWASGRSPGEAAKVQVVTVGRPNLAKFLGTKGFQATDVDVRQLATAMNTADVVVLDVARIDGHQTAEAILEKVRQGRGLIGVSLGWGWAQLNPGKSLVDDHPGNRYLSALGIAWADGYLERTTKDGYSVGSDLPTLLHTDLAIEAVLGHDQGRRRLDSRQLAQATVTVSVAIRALPVEKSPAFVPIRRWAETHAADLIPTPQKPIRLKDGLKRLAITLQTVQMQRLPADQVRAHAAASVFPGTVPEDATRVRQTLQVKTIVPGWHSTGLYAPPGAAIDVTVPEQAARKGLFLRIGCHDDSLWDLDEWRRCPEICTRRPLNEQTSRVACPFGGLIYLEVPDQCRLGEVRVELQGAVEVPYFVFGVTTADEWKTIRRRPGPWAELASDRVVITVPSKFVHDLDDPQAVMETWNQVLDACADLAAIPRVRSRPERYVPDEQISAGYMHSGYPIMTHLDVADRMVSKARLLAGEWGFYHEVGHNHQAGEWTFEGAEEVTCNLFSLYVGETVCHLSNPGHEAVLLGEARDKAYREYAATGPDFRKWQSDPFLALTMYLQLREGFGWEPYKKVFAEYNRLPTDQRPKNDQEKRDQWMVRLSRTVGRNLSPFFQAWGVPISESARTAVNDFPVWMPDGFPPRGILKAEEGR